MLSIPTAATIREYHKVAMTAATGEYPLTENARLRLVAYRKRLNDGTRVSHIRLEMVGEEHETGQIVTTTARLKDAGLGQVKLETFVYRDNDTGEARAAHPEIKWAELALTTPAHVAAAAWQFKRIASALDAMEDRDGPTYDRGQMYRRFAVAMFGPKLYADRGVLAVYNDTPTGYDDLKNPGNYFVTGNGQLVVTVNAMIAREKVWVENGR